MSRTEKVKKIVFISMASSLAIVLSLIQIPYPIAPYMKFDPNDIIILICVVYLGWKSTSLVVFIRSFIRYFNGRGTIFGEIAAFTSSMIFMSIYVITKKIFDKKIKSNTLKYILSCLVALVFTTSSLMILNYVFITPSNIRQTFTTGWTLMEQMNMSSKTYFITFIVPVLTFNLIKWSAVSILTGFAQVKLPKKYLKRYDNEVDIFYASEQLNSETKEVSKKPVSSK